MITLYSGPISMFARKTEIALGEKGIEFERIMVPFTQSAGYSPKHPNVLAANPKAQVPVLVDGDLTLFDSTLIFEYLEEAYPEPALWPNDPRDRARARMLELFADDMQVPEDAGYRAPVVAKIVGITYRQLDYWARTGLVEPSVRPAGGSGTQRLYGFRDILVLKVVKLREDCP